MLSRKKIMLITAVGVALILLLSACKIVVNTKVNPDGSGTLIFSFEITKEDFSLLLDVYGGGDLGIDEDEIFDYMMESSGYGSIEEMCESLGEGMATFEIEPIIAGSEKDGGLACTLTMAFDNLDQLMELMEADDFNVFIDEGSGTFTYELSGPGGASLDEMSYIEEMGIDLSILFEVTAPWEITDHNGSSVSGNTVTWDLLQMIMEGGDLSLAVSSEKAEPTPTPKPEPTPTPKPEPTAEDAKPDGAGSASNGESGDGGGGTSSTTTILIVALVVIVVIFLVSQQKKSGEEM